MHIQYVQVLSSTAELMHFPCITFYGQDCCVYLDFFDVLAVTVAFPVSAGLFEPA